MEVLDPDNTATLWERYMQRFDVGILVIPRASRDVPLYVGLPRSSI